MIEVLRAKLHGIHVTGCDLDYHGSVTLDPQICERAGILPLEFVYIWNKNNGQRISTYVLFGEPGTRCCIMNGAAARCCQKGDPVIICASEYIADRKELYDIQPKVLTFDQQNRVVEELHYDVFPSRERAYDFRIVEDTAKQDG